MRKPYQQYLCVMKNSFFPNKSRHIGQIWERLPSGIIVPSAKVSDTSVRAKTNFIEIKNRADEIEKIFEEAGILLPSNSGLGKLISNAKKLCDNWLLCDKDGLDYEMFFWGLHFDRVADAILLLNHESEKDKHLKALISGTLNFFERKRSKAKSILWELEVWAKLRKRMAKVYLKEPPDIVVDYEDSRVGIACKKLYSEKHVQNVLSEAVKQIEKEFEFGIVAINIDDLLSPDVVLKMESSEAVSEKLNQKNSEFINRHSRHFNKYLSTSRIISTIISTSIIADVPSEKPRFRNTYQWTVWTISELSDRHREQLNNFYNTVMN